MAHAGFLVLLGILVGQLEAAHTAKGQVHGWWPDGERFSQLQTDESRGRFQGPVGLMASGGRAGTGQLGPLRERTTEAVEPGQEVRHQGPQGVARSPTARESMGRVSSSASGLLLEAAACLLGGQGEVESGVERGSAGQGFWPRFKMQFKGVACSLQPQVPQGSRPLEKT